MPAASPAAVTIGSDLSASPDIVASDQTLSAVTIPGRTTASPIDGVIHRWRVRTASPADDDVRLRVIRPLAGDAWLGAGSGPTTAVTGGTEMFTIAPQGLTIAAGDHIGIDNGVGPGVDGAAVMAPTAGAVTNLWGPFLADGESRPGSPFDKNELLVNADVEPDADCDGVGDETQDPFVAPGGCDGVAPAPLEPLGVTPAPLELELRAAKRKTLKRLNVRASCFDEDCEAVIKGRVIVRDGGSGKAATRKRASKRSFKLRTRRTSIEAGAIHKLGLVLERPRKGRAVKRLIAEGARARATITGKATAPDGRIASPKKESVRLTG